MLRRHERSRIPFGGGGGVGWGLWGLKKTQIESGNSGVQRRSGRNEGRTPGSMGKKNSSQEKGGWWTGGANARTRCKPVSGLGGGGKLVARLKRAKRKKKPSYPAIESQGKVRLCARLVKGGNGSCVNFRRGKEGHGGGGKKPRLRGEEEKTRVEHQCLNGSARDGSQTSHYLFNASGFSY